MLRDAVKLAGLMVVDLANSVIGLVRVGGAVGGSVEQAIAEAVRETRLE
jgi:hypothetical protein